MAVTDKDILYQIAKDVGETKEGIDNLKDQFEGTVSKGECTQRHVVVANSIAALKNELIAEFKKGTGQAYPAVTGKMLEKKHNAVLFWIALLTGIGTIGSGIVLGAWKVFDFMSQVQQGLKVSQRELRTEIKASGKPRVVYVTVPSLSAPDAGAPAIRAKRPRRTH
jgi:hypothetical protein